MMRIVRFHITIDKINWIVSLMNNYQTFLKSSQKIKVNKIKEYLQADKR